jgi:hypothetical protein
MRRLGFAVLAVSILLVPPARAWNATGHRVIAAIAYDHLTAKARARVDELLRQHPDYGTLLPRDFRDAFLAASVWPDVIKGDNRFYDDTRANAVPTPLLPGFPTMMRHTNWHYVDFPFSPDGTPLEPVKLPNALEQLQRILKERLTSYDLPWLIHVEGDVHQPLHCVSRFTKSVPKGDAGGNQVFVIPGRNLHAVWDDSPGTDASNEYVNRYASEVTAEFAAKLPEERRGGPRAERDPKKWVEEGFELAQREVYTFGPETGTREHPLVLPAGYERHAKAIAKSRLALAGLRLAAVLNQKLGR